MSDFSTVRLVCPLSRSEAEGVMHACEVLVLQAAEITSTMGDVEVHSVARWALVELLQGKPASFPQAQLRDSITAMAGGR